MTAVTPVQRTRINRLLVANRGEIAIRIFRAASELGIETLAVFADEDKLSLHRFKADEAYQIGRGADGNLRLGPLEAYLSIEEVIRIARMTKADAIHPGYGFLAESPEFAEAWRGQRYRLRRAVSADDAGARQQGFGARACGLGRRAGHTGHRPVAGRCARDRETRSGNRLPAHGEGLMGRGRAWNEIRRQRRSAD